MMVLDKIRKVSYCDYSRRLNEDSQLYTLPVVLNILEEFVFRDGAFISIEINKINTLQFYESDSKIIAEILNDSDDMILKCKYVSIDECMKLIMHFYESDDVKSLQGFYMVPINTKTLEQVMLENKP
jgi:hypothetical protein